MSEIRKGLPYRSSKELKFNSFPGCDANTKQSNWESLNPIFPGFYVQFSKDPLEGDSFFLLYPKILGSMLNEGGK